MKPKTNGSTSLVEGDLQVTYNQPSTHEGSTAIQVVHYA